MLARPARPSSSTGGAWRSPDLEAVARERRPVALSPAARTRWLARARGRRGGGARGRRLRREHRLRELRRRRDPPEPRLRELQLNLVRSHAAGVGDPLARGRDARPSCCCAPTSLARGFSRRAARDPRAAARACSTAASTRSSPTQGSVGASGDLAPLAHLALALDRRGRGGARRAARCRPPRRCAEPGSHPVVARGQGGPRAHQRHPVHDRARRARAGREPSASRECADVAGAMTLEALKGTRRGLRRADPRGAPASRAAGVAPRNLRRLLADSEIRESHRDCGKVQDAYSLRCMPQVHGAARDALAFAPASPRVEMNAATDNPLVFAETRRDRLRRQLPRRSPWRIALDVLAIARGRARLPSASGASSSS